MPLLFAVAPVQTIGLPILVALSWVPYHLRARTLAAHGRPVPRWRRFCFVAGLLVLEVAFSSPVDHLSDQLLVAHMAEHLLIGDIASLLLVLGLTGPVIAPLLHNPVISRLRVLSHPVVAVVLWGLNFYVWHSPYLYQQALRHDALHALEHATFLTFGVAVWMGLLGPLPQPRWFSNSARLIYIVAMRLIGTVLANIMIFGGTVFYPYYRPGDAHWHISAMADQVAAGGLMMVEESLLTIGAVLLAVPARGPRARAAPGAAGLRRPARPRARRPAGRPGGGGRPRRRAGAAPAGARRRHHARAA